MSSNDSQRGYSIDTRGRRRRQIGIGIVAAVVIAVVAIVVINAAGGSDAGAKSFGPDMKVAFFSAFPAEEELIDFVGEEVAPDYGITVKAASLGEPQAIDRSVSEGENAATTYEHKYWMQQEIESGGFKLAATTPIFKWAFSLYSDKYKKVSEIPRGGTVVIPSDPSNLAQALWLLESQGLVKLKPGTSAWSAEVSDIVENPRDLKFKEIEVTDVPRALGDVDAAVSYTAFYETAGISPADEIVTPVPPAPFDSQLVVGKDYVNDPNIKKLIEAWKDPRVQTFVEEQLEPALMPITAKPTIGPNVEFSGESK
jgi:D-methionine transport system substrate-binding protein